MSGSVAAGSSPQMEAPVNGEDDKSPLSETAATPSIDINKATTSPNMNVGAAAGSGPPEASVPNPRPVAGGMVTSPRSHQANPPASPMSQRGVVPMSRLGASGGQSSTSGGNWNQSGQYNSRPPMNRYGGGGGNEAPPPGYGNYQARPYSNYHGSESLSKSNLYIRGLTATTTDQDLAKLCHSYGKIKSTKAIVDQVSGKCKGYGFVDFEKPSDAERATHHLQQSGIQAQMAKVRESSHEQDPTNLYIANLPDYVDENYLENLVRNFGTIVSVRILRDQAGNSRNVGFCRMDNKEICERIVQELNKKPLPGCKEPLLIKFADSGHRRKREFRNQHAMMTYDNMQHGHMGGQMMSQGNVGMNPRYSMPPVNTQSNYLQNAAAASGNWGAMPMYPQVAMSPVNPVTSIQNTMIDPASVLATQISQMQIAAATGQNYGMQQNQQSYPPMYQNPPMIPQYQYEMSASPPNQLAHGIDEHNYQTFGQM